jgi:hypothetical protein
MSSDVVTLEGSLNSERVVSSLVKLNFGVDHRSLRMGRNPPTMDAVHDEALEMLLVDELTT